MIRLYELRADSKNKDQYRKAADKIVASLTNDYRSPIGENNGFILLHSTGARPFNSEVDVPLSYADYYYLEALMRFKKNKRREKIILISISYFLTALITACHLGYVAELFISFRTIFMHVGSK